MGEPGPGDRGPPDRAAGHRRGLHGDPIRVLQVATSYPRDPRDWRGRFIADICGALGRRPDLKLALWAPPGEREAGIDAATTPGEARWLGMLMERGGISHWLRTRPASGLIAAARLLRMLSSAYRRQPADIYHVNWLQCALPLPADGRPALISVLGNDMHLLRLPMMRQALARSMRGRRVALCPNANWMEKPLREMFGDRAIVQCVPFGIDPRWYAVRRPVEGLRTPPAWLAVTRLTANKLGPLFEWSEPLFRDGRRELHVFGPMQEDIQVPGWVHYHGPATPEQLATEWFPSAQGLVTLSRHAEGRPQVMLEAMAAKLPIVASQLQAHADLIEDGRTGLLCASPQGYAEALARLEESQLNVRVGAAACAWAHVAFGDWDDCAERYVGLYRQLLEQPSHG